MAKMKLSTRAKRSVSRSTGIPTTRSGRSRKVSRATSGCMTLILSVVLAVVLLSWLLNAAIAESSARDFVESRGYAITDISDASGMSPKCYLLENEESQSLAFVQDEKLYTIVSLPMLSVDYDYGKMHSLFLDLVTEFDWNVSFYWPDHGSGAKIKVSYGIVDDLDKTEKNFYDKESYLSALSSEFNPSGAEFDLNGLSFDELVALKDQINFAIWNSQEWQEVTVPQGVWLVGEDIPEGHWSVKAVDGTVTFVQICAEIDETGHNPVKDSVFDKKGVYSPSYGTYEEGHDVTSWDFNVVAGNYIVISDGDAVFSPYAGKPSLGFK